MPAVNVRAEHGFSLVELLAAMLVGGVVLAGAFGLLDAAVRSHADTAARTQAVRDGRLALDRITRQLRLANCAADGTPAVVAAAADSITVHTTRPLPNFNAPVADELRTVRVETVSGGRRVVLDVSSRAPGATAYVARPGERRVLADRIALDGAAPLFTYLPYLSPTAPEVGAPLPVPVTAAALREQIAQVQLRFVALPPRGADDDPRGQRFDDRVVLRTDDPTDDDPGTEC